MQQYTTFSEAYKMLQDHLEEFVITEEVLRDWPTYYEQVFQQTRQTREHIQALERRKRTEEALRNTIQDQIVLETAKLQRLERQAHQWVQQALPSLDKLDTIFLYLKRLLEAAEEKDQLLGPNMGSIADLTIQEKMSTLSSITTLTIDIQNFNINWLLLRKKLLKYAYKNDQPSDYIAHENKQ